MKAWANIYAANDEPDRKWRWYIEMCRLDEPRTPLANFYGAIGYDSSNAAIEAAQMDIVFPLGCSFKTIEPARREV